MRARRRLRVARRRARRAGGKMAAGRAEAALRWACVATLRVRVLRVLPTLCPSCRCSTPAIFQEEEGGGEEKGEKEEEEREEEAALSKRRLVRSSTRCTSSGANRR